MESIKLLDVVALLEELPEESLKRGEVGTVVEIFAPTPDRPGAYLVEFSDRNGVAYAMTVLRPEQLILLHYRQAA